MMDRTDFVYTKIGINKTTIVRFDTVIFIDEFFLQLLLLIKVKL